MDEDLPVRQPGATLHESMPSVFTPSRPVFTPHSSDVDSPAGAPGYDSAPPHYRGTNGLQSFDIWDDYAMDPYRATAWKYFTRYQKKGSTRNDLEKLVHYIDEAVIRQPEYTENFLDPAQITFSPEIVIEAFGLEGLMASAAKDFLLSFTVTHPRVYLRSAKSQVEAYIKSLE